MTEAKVKAKKILNTDILVIHNILSELNTVSNPWFMYWASETLSSIESRIEAIHKAEAAIQSDPGFKELAQKRQQLLEKYAAKDELGAPKTEEVALAQGGKVQQYVLTKENKAEYNKVIAEVMLQYKDIIAEEETKAAEYNNILGKEANISLKGIRMSDVPKNLFGFKEFHFLRSLGLLIWDLVKEGD